MSLKQEGVSSLLIFADVEIIGFLNRLNSCWQKLSFTILMAAVPSEEIANFEIPFMLL